MVKFCGWCRFTSVLVIWSSGMFAGAEIYKWVDADGKVHFSDQKSDAAQKVEIKTPTTRLNSGGESTRQINSRIKHAGEKLAQERAISGNKQQIWSQKSQQQKQRAKSTCQYYKDKLANLEFRWELQNKKGYRQSQKDRYLGKKDQYKRDIKRNC